jgi:hypothetical protein
MVRGFTMPSVVAKHAFPWNFGLGLSETLPAIWLATGGAKGFFP